MEVEIMRMHKFLVRLAAMVVFGGAFVTGVAHACGGYEQATILTDSDDRRDLANLSNLASLFDQAWELQDRAALLRTERKVLRLLDNELWEARRELHAARREVRNLVNKVGVQADCAPFDVTCTGMNQRWNLRAQTDTYRALREIRADWVRLSTRTTYKALTKKREMLRELVWLARSEVWDARRRPGHWRRG